MSVRLDTTVRIAVLEPLRAVNDALIDLLRGFDDADWHRPTVAPDRTVKDVAAHLLHGSLRRVTALRDRYRPPASESYATRETLTAFIQENNRAFMQAMALVSPSILGELLARYDAEMLALFAALPPDDLGLGVVWAGEWQSQNWFDIAREYTEKWHHQQQLRDATGRPPLYAPALLEPALETFARGLPFAYRAFPAADGTRIAIAVRGAAALAWTLQRDDGAWSLWSGRDPRLDATLELEAAAAWRIWTKELAPADALTRITITGDRSCVMPMVEFVATMA
jgi:uncharacterized protein (TIGR03083 family)